MNTIGAFSPLTAKTFKNTAFKGNNPQNNTSSPIQNNTASAQDALANMALADIEMAKKIKGLNFMPTRTVLCTQKKTAASLAEQ